MILIKKSNPSWPIKNFTKAEVEKASEGMSFVWSKKLLKTLQAWDEIRDYLDKPVIITDASRLKGSTTSQHYFKRFTAIDGWTENLTSEELMQIVEKKDLGLGRGLYPYDKGFIHLDYGDEPKPHRDGSIVRWYRDEDGNYHTVDSFDNLIK